MFGRHILVIGATGQVGLAFVQEALKTGHRLTLYVRSPSKLPKDVVENINVTIVEGDFNNMAAFKQALETGPEVLVSLAGPAIPNKGTAITQFYETIFPFLPEHSSIKRVIILSTASYKAPEDKGSIKWWFGVHGVKVALGSAYEEINGLSRATAALPLDKIEWTLFRVPGLINGNAKPVKAGFVGDGESDGLTITRNSIGVWILQELGERRWIGKAPVLSNPGWC